MTQKKLIFFFFLDDRAKAARIIKFKVTAHQVMLTLIMSVLLPHIVTQFSTSFIKF